MDNKLISGVLVVAVLGLLGVSAFKNTTVTVNNPAPQVLGGSGSGQDSYARQFFREGLTQGGYAATSSTATAFTTTATEFGKQPVVIAWTPNVNTTLSISATSTFAYVPSVGDVAQVYFLNASTTAGSSITFAAAGTGTDMQFAEATGGDLVLNGLDWAKVTLIRKSLHQVTFIFDEMTEAD